jgi:hypothetical protein
MSPRLMQRMCWWVLVVFTGIGLVFTFAVNRGFTSNDLVVVPLFGYALVGAVVAFRRPENPIGWIFLMIGLLTGVASFAGAGAERAFNAGPPIAWWGVLSAWYNNWFWWPLFMLATTFTFLLFPSGLPSRRWRPVLWLAVVATITASVIGALAPTIELGVDPTTADSVMIANPLSPSFASRMGIAENSWWLNGPLIVGLLCGFAAIVSVVLRTWRAEGVERQQMRLFAFAIALVPLQILVSELFPAFGNSWYGGITFALALTSIAVACGLAILRYHLYDIDRIIGRTTAYGLVTGALLAVYVSVVTAVTQLLPESGDLAVAAATLAAAAVFRPALAWARRLVNRRFNRERYDAERAVEQFAARLRDEVDPNKVSGDLLTLLGRTVQPAASGLWLRDPTS